VEKITQAEVDRFLVDDLLNFCRTVSPDAKTQHQFFM